MQAIVEGLTEHVHMEQLSMDDSGIGPLIPPGIGRIESLRVTASIQTPDPGPEILNSDFQQETCQSFRKNSHDTLTGQSLKL